MLKEGIENLLEKLTRRTINQITLNSMQRMARSEDTLKSRLEQIKEKLKENKKPI